MGLKGETELTHGCSQVADHSGHVYKNAGRGSKAKRWWLAGSGGNGVDDLLTVMWVFFAGTKAAHLCREESCKLVLRGMSKV